MRLYIGSNAVAYATNFALSLSAEVLETVHKDNAGAGWTSGKSGQKSGTVTIDGFYNEDGANNTPSESFDNFAAGTELTCVIDTTATGDTTYNFTGFFSSFDINADVADSATWSGTLTIVGQVTTALNP